MNRVNTYSELVSSRFCAQYNPMKKLLTLLLSTALISCAPHSDETDVSSSDISKLEVLAAPDFNVEAMNTLLSSAVNSGEVLAVSSLVFDEGQVVYEGAFGLGDRERNVALTRDSVFRIYSMTKPITSAVIMDLVEEGKINLNDPVSKYIPQLASMKVASLGADGQPVFEDQVKEMTVEDLLLHRAGMGYGIFGEINAVETAYTKAGLFEPSEGLSVKMDKLGQLPLLTQPGTGWYYSYSIDVLGRIIEVVTEQRLGEALKERVFDPLGMSETAFSVRADQASRFVSNYLIQEDGSFIVIEDRQNSPFLKDNAFQSGGGGLVSTLGDYAKFAEMILNEGSYNGARVLEAETVKTMLSDQMDADDVFMMPWLGDATGAGFGYGGSVQTSVTQELVAEKGRHVGQWGWSGAARTKFHVDPENNSFAIIMLQFFGGEDPELHDRWQALTLEGTKN